MKDRHCSHCGQEFAVLSWPRQCSACCQTTWRNPLPVGVVLLPVGEGILLIRRGEEPQKGQLALPGGHLECDETWQKGIVRELQEEAQVDVNESDITLFDLHSTQSNMLVVFGLAPRQDVNVISKFKPNDEVTELLVIDRPVELAFPTHTLALRKFFAGR
jgi:ADP-ribose pyrophosphatase YjhB (NUDIX family)